MQISLLELGSHMPSLACNPFKKKNSVLFISCRVTPVLGRHRNPTLEFHSPPCLKLHFRPECVGLHCSVSVYCSRGYYRPPVFKTSPRVSIYWTHRMGIEALDSHFRAIETFRSSFAPVSPPRPDSHVSVSTATTKCRSFSCRNTCIGSLDGIRSPFVLISCCNFPGISSRR